MTAAAHLVDALARGICRDLGHEPDQPVNIAPKGAEPIIVDEWVRHRPTALAIATTMVADLGEAGVGFLDSAVRVVTALRGLDGQGGA